MKIKHLLTKTLLVAAGLLVGASAWAQTTVTYDFTSYSAKTLTNSGTKAFSANSVNHNYASNFPEVHNRFAFQFAGAFSIVAEGLYAARAKGDHVGIMSLASGDKVTINFSAGDIMVRGAVPSWAGNTSAWTNYTTGTEITTSTAGNLSFQAKNSCKISSVVIVTSATETMTAPSISSEASGSKRTVTITDGASSLLAPVTTYYTTDGSAPTASSTVYTAPFDVDATCTIKAITISNSSAATASAITSQLIDLDAVDVPTAAITAVDGINRTVTFSCTTVGADLYYSTDNGETYTSGTSLVISSNTNIKVKATKGSASAESENIAFEAGTEIVLNTPTWTKTGYSAGVSTVTLADNQSDKLLSPASTIKYQINDGAEQTYSAAINVNDGETLKYWSEATGYTKSPEGSVLAAAPNSNVVIVSENYAGVVGSNNNLSLADGDGYRLMYYNEGADLVSENLLASNINNGSYYMMYRASGLYPASGWNLAIPNLQAGDYITLNGAYGNAAFEISGASNMTADLWNSTAGSKYCYTVNADGQVTFTMARYGYLQSITIRRASVPAKITSSTGFATLYTTCALDFSTTGLKAYTASYDGSKVTLTQVNDVPANTGVVLEGAADNYDIPVIASSSTAKGDLEGSATATAFNAIPGYDLYMLAQNGGNVQFKKVTSGEIAAGKAFLKVAASPAPAFDVVFEGNLTGIRSIENGNLTKDNVVYDLQGRKVANPTKGLYIQNGRKVILK